MKYRHSFKINALPKMPRLLQGHWRGIDAYRKEWHRYVANACLMNKPAKPLKFSRVWLVRASATVCDFDNLVFSFKPVLDGLVLAGVLEDDAMENIIEQHYAFSKVKRKEQHITVTVEEA